MRCLTCHRHGLSVRAETCPHCGVHVRSMLRDTLPPGTELLGGRYRIDYPVSQDASWIMYRAVVVGREQIVVIKELFPREAVVRHPDDAHVNVIRGGQARFDASVTRLLDQARLLAGLNHPSLMGVHDQFAEHGTAYLAMELVDGRTLREFLDVAPDGALAEALVRSIVGQLAAALDVIHAAGLVHLDVRPENVVYDDRERVVLGAFGAMRPPFEDGRVVPVDTIEYASPEEATGHEVGPGSDIFSLGVLAHELLTGRRPPNSLTRLLRDDWHPEGHSERWSRLLESALTLQLGARPATGADWLKSSSASPPPSPTADVPWSVELSPEPVPAAEVAPPPDSLPPPPPGIVPTPIVEMPIMPTPKDIPPKPASPPIADSPGRTLDRLLAEALPDAEVTLEPGVYVLEDTLVLSQPVTIVGAGVERTRIESAVEGVAVKLASPGTITLRDLTVAHVGDAWAHVLVAQAGNLQIERCRLTGAVASSDRRHGGVGLCTIGSARVGVDTTEIVGNGYGGVSIRSRSQATMRRSVCQRNVGCGVFIDTEKSATLEGNIIETNDTTGVRVIGKSQATIVNNLISANGRSGISVEDDAIADLTANRVEDNAHSGVAYRQRTRGKVAENVCRGNRRDGIYVDETAAPDLTGNVCERNLQSGITYFGDAGGSASENVLEQNGRDGIYVDERSTPLLSANTIRQNGANGIMYFGQAAGIARANLCQRNQHRGISLAEKAAPELSENRCEENLHSGLGYFGESAGIARENVLRANASAGITVGGQATPELIENTLERNKANGLAYQDQGTGVARGNTLRTNARSGIYVGGEAAPTLIGNQAIENGRDGIAVSAQARPRLASNLCLRNVQDGIFIGEEARPDLGENRCEENSRHQVNDRRPT